MAKEKPKRCRAKSKQSGKRCKRWAVEGKRVCYMHGGATPKGGGGPPGNTKALKHGFYSNALTGDEKQLYDNVRVNPNSLDDHIALLEVKIHRYVMRNGVDFNFDDWQTDTHQEFTRAMHVEGEGEDNIPVRVQRIIKKPQGPAMLCTMLDTLCRMYWRRHQMLVEGEGEDADEVMLLRLPLAVPKRLRHRELDDDS